MPVCLPVHHPSSTRLSHYILTMLVPRCASMSTCASSLFYTAPSLYIETMLVTRCASMSPVHHPSSTRLPHYILPMLVTRCASMSTCASSLFCTAPSYSGPNTPTHLGRLRRNYFIYRVRAILPPVFDVNFDGP